MFPVEDRATVIATGRSKKYPVEVIERYDFDLVFISDRSGNRFELKQR